MMRLAALLACLGAVLLASVATGELALAPGQIWLSLVGAEGAEPQVTTILWQLRLPRAALAVLVGAALGMAGSVTQAMIRNPLAEPGLLGISAGAALAATILIVRDTAVSEAWLPVASFVGALAAAVAVFALAWRGSGTSPTRIILTGIAVSAVAGAGASFISAFGGTAEVQRAMVWMAGSLQDARWIKSAVLAC